MEELTDAIRRARGLDSMEKFATSLGVTRQTVNAWEKGRSIPSQVHALKLERRGIPRKLLVEALLQAEAKRRAA